MHPSRIKQPGWKLAIAVCFLSLPALQLHCQKVPIETVFAEVPFDRWLKEGPSKQIPWKVRMLSGKLSLHQRLEASIEVHVPGPELLKRRHDGHLVLLVQVTDEAGNQYRNYGFLEAKDFRPELSKADVVYSWQAFVLPGRYDVAVGLFDKETEEHNFARGTWHVDRMKSDPLPGAWQELPSVEFWAPESRDLDQLYRSDIERRLHLPITPSEPIHLEILVDLTPSEAFAGNQKLYENYLAGALPMMKALSQIRTPTGSPDVAGLDLYQAKVIFEQRDGTELDWPRLKAALALDKGPAVVNVNSLQQHVHTPVFLRDEIARRLAEPGEAGDPLSVYIVIGQNTDAYTFPHLPSIVEAKHCVVFYLQYGTYDTVPIRGPARGRGVNAGGTKENLIDPTVLFGDAGKVSKMLQPLPVHVFQVHSPETFRQALARILQEISHM
jgi:hypothetical protein